MGIVALLYGVVAYFILFAAILYLVAFVGGDMIPLIEVPKTIDAGNSIFAGAPAALVNIGLLVLFGLQHTIMARPAFKKVWTKIVPPSVERSTYVLITALLLGLWATVLTALFYAGFAIMFLSTFLINHFDLFGLQQVWARFQKKDLPAPRFVTPVFYKWVRHPLYLGFIIAFWAAPLMTTGHLLFAAIWTIYIFVAVGYEERDLTDHFGDEYRTYAARVPMIFPFGKRKG